MQRVLEWALLALAAVGCRAATQQALQASDLPAVPRTVATARQGVTPDVIQMTGCSSDVTLIDAGSAVVWPGLLTPISLRPPAPDAAAAGRTGEHKRRGLDTAMRIPERRSRLFPRMRIENAGQPVLQERLSAMARS